MNKQCLGNSIYVDMTDNGVELTTRYSVDGFAYDVIYLDEKSMASLIEWYKKIKNVDQL